MTHKKSVVRLASWEGRLLRSSDDGKGVRLGAQIAHGGFGVVHRGWLEPGGREVAVKILLGARDDERVRVFQEEAALLATLQHPNVAGVVTTGVADDAGVSRPWMAIDWCEGWTLAAELERRAGKRHTRAEAWALLGPVVDALAHAHARGCVHRDLKPANVMLTPGLRGALVPRVIDWGIGKRVAVDAAVGSGQTATQGAFQAFTARYAAPEQIASLRTGPWTDVHALGLMFTELLIGKRPIDDEHGILAVISPTRPTPAAFQVDAGPWEPVLARALSLQANERFRTAAELGAALSGALGARGVEPPAEPLAAEVARSAPAARSEAGARARAVAWLVAAGVGACLAAVLLVLWVAPSSRASRSKADERGDRRGSSEDARRAPAAPGTPPSTEPPRASASASAPQPKPIRALASLDDLDDDAVGERAPADLTRLNVVPDEGDGDVRRTVFNYHRRFVGVSAYRARFPTKARRDLFAGSVCKEESPCAIGGLTLLMTLGEDREMRKSLRDALVKGIPGVELRP